MMSSALSTVVMKALRRDTMASHTPPAWKVQSLHVYETHQHVVEVILELPELGKTIDDLNLSSARDNVITDVKLNLAFVPRVLPTYLPVLQTWCHSFRECNEHTLGLALARSDIAYIDKTCEQVMTSVAKAHKHLHLLPIWTRNDAKDQFFEHESRKECMKVKKAVRKAFHHVDDVYEYLLAKMQNNVILTRVQFKDITEKYKYFWEACLLNLDGLRPLGEDWDTLHARFFLWGSGMFEGPMSLDKYLRWPESNAPGAEGFKQKIILNSFANILHYSGKCFAAQAYTSSRLMPCLEIELKALHIQSEIPDKLRTHLELVLVQTQTALVKEDLFNRVMLSWSTDMSSRVGGDSATEEYVGTKPVESIGRSMHTLERLGNTLVMERPRALAKREAQMAAAKTKTEQASLRLVDRPVVPISPPRLMTTAAEMQGKQF